MNMVEKEKDLIGFAHRVIGFRMDIIKACTSKGITPPTDEQISDYINGYGLNVEDFMADYTEHEGMFRCLKTPLDEFKDAVSAIHWSTAPTEDEIVEFFNANGNNVELFCQQRTIKKMKPLVRKTCLKTIEQLSAVCLVKLWNTFIEESGLYGEDSYIYDLTNEKDIKVLRECMKPSEFEETTTLSSRFIQWFDLNGRAIHPKKDIKSVIIGYWEEIFERIMLYPSAYNFNVEIYYEGDGSTYFDDVFFPIIAKEVGYLIDGTNGTIKEITK